MASGVQVHDFNPGIDPNGLFWTTLLPDDSVQVSFSAGTASMTVVDLQVEDHFNLSNVFTEKQAPVRAVVSFALEWSRPAKRLSNASNTAPDHFTGQYVFNSASMRWSAATSTGFRFNSDQSAATTSVYALLGQEHNGVFF